VDGSNWSKGEGDQRLGPRHSRRRFFEHGLTVGAGLAGLALEAGPLPEARAATPAPKHGGTLVGAQDVDPVSLDPHTSSNFSSLVAYEQIYESLTAYDERLKIIPALAERWEVTNGGQSVTFHLRPNVRFHNGQTMTADDVKYSIDRVLDPKTTSLWRSWFDPVLEVRVVDPLRIQVALKAPYPGLLGAFAGMRGSGIMPKGLAERENLKIRAIGTGPFRLVEYVPQDRISYVRHADYWDRPLPYLDAVTFKIVPEENARLAALRAGQVQYAPLTAQGAAQVRGAASVTLLQGPTAWVEVHAINVAVKPLDDARVRKAMRMAVDTNEVIQKAAFGAGVPCGPIPTGYADWYLDPEALPYRRADLAGAKKLLAEAGYPNGGFKIQVKCTPQYPFEVASTLVVQDALKALGIGVDVVQLEWGAFISDTKTAITSGGSQGGEIFANGATFKSDPDGYVYPYFDSRGSQNFGGYQNAILDRLMEQARSISNHDQRKSLYREIQTILLEQSPWWWYTRFNIEALAANVRGYVQSFTGRRIFLRRAWLA
jgi:peptide/nickel transport system substrate-binding protein